MHTSRQRRLISERTAQDTPKSPTSAPQAKADPVPQAQAAPQPNPEADTSADPAVAGNPAEKVQLAIKAIERLRDAAEDMEAAKFALQQHYSDFSTGRKLDALKAELIKVISKAKEHINKTAAESPEAREAVSKWMKL